MRRVVLIVLVVLVGCDGGDDGAASTTAPPETTTTVDATTTTAAPDPFSVPDDPADIDAAYVEAVLTELERINGDALRLAVSEGLSPTVRELIESVYAPELAAVRGQSLVDASLTGFEGFASPPGDVRSQVDVVHTGTTTCVSVDARQDFTAVVPSGRPDVASRIELRQSSGLNPTPWIYSLQQPLEAELALPEPCAAS